MEFGYGIKCNGSKLNAIQSGMMGYNEKIYLVELSVYNGIPHLMIPVITDPKKASDALHWAIEEMEDRYRKFADENVKNLDGYNKKILEGPVEPGQDTPKP